MKDKFLYMAELFYQSPFHCCDVALREKFLTDYFDPNNVTKLVKPEDNALRLSIGKIFPSGTCFAISKLNETIKINNKNVLAFALTNFHVAYDLVTREKNKPLYVYFDYRDKEIDNDINSNLVSYFECSPILELHTKLNSVQISNSNNPYCLPNDLAVLAIYQYNSLLRPIVPNLNNCMNINVFQIADEDEVIAYNNQQVLISGYPTRSKDLHYILPDDDNIENVEIKIKNGFHNFNSQVISEGHLTISGSGLAELCLSSTSGMSGSPILTGTTEDSKVVGIYCGGPPLPGQYELIQVARNLIDLNYERAYELLLNLPFENRSMYSSRLNFKNFKVDVLILLYLEGSEYLKKSILEDYPEVQFSLSSIKNPKTTAKNILMDLINNTQPLLLKTVPTYEQKEIFTYNCGISARSEVFNYIRRVKSIVESLVMDFESEEEFEAFLFANLKLN